MANLPNCCTSSFNDIQNPIPNRATDYLKTCGHSRSAQHCVQFVVAAVDSGGVKDLIFQRGTISGYGISTFPISPVSGDAIQFFSNAPALYTRLPANEQFFPSHVILLLCVHTQHNISLLLRILLLLSTLYCCLFFFFSLSLLLSFFCCLLLYTFSIL